MAQRYTQTHATNLRHGHRVPLSFLNTTPRPSSVPATCPGHEGSHLPGLLPMTGVGSGFLSKMHPAPNVKPGCLPRSEGGSGSPSWPWGLWVPWPWRPLQNPTARSRPPGLEWKGQCGLWVSGSTLKKLSAGSLHGTQGD